MTDVDVAVPVALERRVRLPRWRRYAACRGRVALFYDPSPVAETIACAICATCGVRERCLADALDVEGAVGVRYGVRGGLTAAQRRDRR